MAKKFYTAGVCIPEQNYMMDKSSDNQVFLSFLGLLRILEGIKG